MPIQVDEVVVARDELVPRPCQRPARGRRQASAHGSQARRHEGRSVRGPGLPPRPARRRSGGLDPAAQADDPAHRRQDRVRRSTANRARTARHRHPEPRTDRMAPGGRARPRGAPRPQDAGRHRPTRQAPEPPRPTRSGGRGAPRDPAPVPPHPGATIGRRCPTDPTSPPARSPASASSTARRSSPGRTARCCSATSVPRSSRSSRRRATRPAAGVRRGSARSRRGTRTAAYYLAVNRNKRGLRLDLKSPDGAAVLRRLLADADVLVENFRGDGFARLGFDDEALQRAEPAARPPRDLGLRHERPGRRPARLRLHRPGRRAG